MKKTIALTITALLLITMIGGCAAYTKHSEKFSDAIGKWSLNCIYIDTKPATFAPQVMEIKKDKTGNLIETLTITAAQMNPDGSVAVPAVTENKEYPLTFEATTGQMTITRDGASVTYTFNVDVPAGLLHMYTTIEEKEYHYIYLIIE